MKTLTKTYTKTDFQGVHFKITKDNNLSYRMVLKSALDRATARFNKDVKDTEQNIDIVYIISLGVYRSTYADPYGYTNCRQVANVAITN